MRNKIKTYSGKPIAQQLLEGTKLGNWLYGESKTYIDGYGKERKDANFKESANGQLVDRMKNTAINVGRTTAENLWDVPMDIYSGIESGIQGNWSGAGLAAASLFLPQTIEGVVKQAMKQEDIVSQIKKAVTTSDQDFSKIGKNNRKLMTEEIPENKEIIEQLTDQELGWLIQQRNSQLYSVPSGSRFGVIHESVSNPSEISKIEIVDNDGIIGTLTPEYKNAISGTVSVGHVENIGGTDINGNNIKRGVSEDAYNVLMQATGKPMSAGTTWKMPEFTSKVYSKFEQDIPSGETLVADWPFHKVLQDPSVKTLAIRQAGLEKLTVAEQNKRLNDIIEEMQNQGQTRWPLQQPRSILAGPNKEVLYKNGTLFKITPENIVDGFPIIRWDINDELLKQGGSLPKFQPGGTLPNWNALFKANASGAPFMRRVWDVSKKSIPDWENNNYYATHKMSYHIEDDGSATVYPEVQEINGELVDYSDPKNRDLISAYWNAIHNSNIVKMTVPEAEWFTKNYKKYYPGF